MKFLTKTRTFFLLCIAFATAPAQAAIINAADFDTPPYAVGAVNGQNPAEAGSLGAWTEQNNASDFQVISGGLSVEAKGTVGRVDGGSGHLKENGNNSGTVIRNYGGFTGTETELWYRAVLQPQIHRYFTHYGTPGGGVGLFSDPSCGLYLDGGISNCKFPDLYVPNLVILRQTIDRSPGGLDVVKGWVNPSSYDDIAAGVGYDLYSALNTIEGTSSPDSFRLNWESSRVAGDSLAISSSLGDLVEKVPGPLPIAGVGVGFAMSRRLRQRIKQVSK